MSNGSTFWASLGAPDTGPLANPAVGNNADGRLEVFAVGNEGATLGNGRTRPGGALWHTWQVLPNDGWPVWETLGGAGVDENGEAYTQTYPAVANNADGSLVVFTASPGDGLYVNLASVAQAAPNDGWGDWSFYIQENDSSLGPPALVREADGRLEAFAPGLAIEMLRQAAPNGGWDIPFVQLPSGLYGPLAVGRNADGRLEVFAGENHVWQLVPGGGWAGPASLGSVGHPIADIAVANNADGRLEVFVTDGVGGLWHAWQQAPNDGWSGWRPFGNMGRPFPFWDGPPAVGRNADGRLELFVIGGDGVLWHIAQGAPNDGWLGWSSLGGPPGGFADSRTGPGIDRVAVGSNADGRLEVFGVSTDGALWHTWQTQGCSVL